MVYVRDNSRLLLLRADTALGAGRRNGAWGARLGRPSAADNMADNVEPLLGIRRGMCLECELRAAGEHAAHRLGPILAFDVELVSARLADHSIRKIDAQLRRRILAQVVIILELVEELGRGHDVVARLVAPVELVAALPLQAPLDKRLGRVVVHVWELDAVNISRILVRVHQGVGFASSEALPLEIRGDALGRAEHVAEQSSALLRLARREGVERLHSLLDHADDVHLEGLEIVLNRNQVVAMIILLEHLSAQPMDDTSLNHIGVLGGGHLSSGGLEGRCSLAKKLDMLLRGVAGLLDLLCTFLSSVC